MANKKKSLSAITPSAAAAETSQRPARRQPDLMNFIFGPDSDSEEAPAGAESEPPPKKSQASNLTDFGWVKKQVYQEIPGVLQRRGYVENTRSRDVRSGLLFLAIAVSPLAYALPSNTDQERALLYSVFAAFFVLYLAQWIISPPRSRMMDTLPCSAPAGCKYGILVDEGNVSIFQPADSISLIIASRGQNSVSAAKEFKVTSVMDERGYVSMPHLEAEIDSILKELYSKL